MPQRTVVEVQLIIPTACVYGAQYLDPPTQFHLKVLPSIALDKPHINIIHNERENKNQQYSREDIKPKFILHTQLNIYGKDVTYKKSAPVSSSHQNRYLVFRIS